MRKKMSRFIAGILFACMVAGSIPAEAVYGADNVAGNSQESEQNQSGAAGNTTVTDEEQLPGGNEEIQDNADDNEQKTEEESSEEPEGTFIDNEESDVPGNENDILPASDGDSAAEATAGESEEAERAEINFVYIESPYLETPGTQRIVFSFDREITESESVTLTVEDETGIQEEWGLAQRTDHLYLFEKEYTGDSYTGTYHAVSLNFHDGQNGSIILEDAGVEAEFGVNEKYDGIEELQPVDDSAVTEAEQSQVEASVVTIDENGVTQAQDSIADALNAVSVQNASANGISMFSADVSTGARTARAGDIVVALDPGHDAWDAGARGNGLAEEDLTLKIANYCKEELEQYAGVSVYMTRTGPECPYGIWGVGCIEKRVQAAANAGAQIFVSFHLNSSVSSSANGAEVIVPNYSWKYSVGAAGHTLGQAILDELVKLGLTDRGIYSKDTTINERYPDGSISDYFGVQIYCKEQGIPGIIVEHAFISNSGDANSFLKTEAGLKSLGVADATGIAKYLGLSKGYWETDNQGNKYYYENGQKVYGTKKIGDSWYYFDSEKNGAMYMGWRRDEGYTYYYRNDGSLCFGVEQIDGAWYYFKENNGIMHTGWRTDGGYTYYYDDSGKLSFGEMEIDGWWYYFKENNGIMYTGWRQDGDYTYYYDNSGKLSFGTKNINGSWYYFSEKNGIMHIGWRQDGKDTYYYDKDGKLCFGTLKIEEAWYYFSEKNGIMHTGWREDGDDTYYYDSNGRLLFGSQKIDGAWYYFDNNSAVMKTGWQENANNKKVYYAEDGKSARGCYQLGANWYYFDERNGEMHTGWRQDGKNTYYYNAKGHLLFGEQDIDKHWYYFNKNNGIMHTGWRQDGKNTYYYDIDGTLTFGTKVIDGVEYYFNTNTGALVEKLTFTTIQGVNSVTVKQMVDFYKANSPIAYPAEELGKGGASTVEEFAKIFYEEASAEGIKVEVAWCQSMLETGWLKFGGQVDISQFNFAGLGATDGGAKGADFSSYGKNGVRMGIRAQIQHLKAYADPDITEATLHYSCVDPRFKYVSPKGCAPYVEYLGQKENPSGKGWATAERYGYRIVELIEKLKKM